MADDNSKTSENVASTNISRFRGTHDINNSKDSLPVLPWSEVLLALKCGDTFVSANVVRFMLPVIKKEEKALAREHLAQQFRETFPGKPFHIRFPEGNQGDERYTEVEVRKDIIYSKEIVSTAATKRWSVLRKPLGPPALIGANIPDDHYVIKVSNIPARQYLLFLRSLKAVLAQSLSRGSDVAIEVVDVFFVEEFLVLAKFWTFSHSVAVVVRLPVNSNGPALAHDWPGYICWDSVDLLTPEYMNRYNYYEICKHTAQELDGPNARHETSACPKRGGQQA